MSQPRAGRLGRRRPRARDGSGLVLALHKPYGVLSQFTPDGSAHRPLRELGLPADVYPVGRLDADSEGLLILSSRPGLTAELLDPDKGHPREYWAQVERVPGPEALAGLREGLDIKTGRTRPAEIRLLSADEVSAGRIPDREPPIRFRKSVPTQWVALTLTEGKNRQVRRMTAAVGHPTLRLLRIRIGAFELGSLGQGEHRELSDEEITQLRRRP